MPEKLHRWFKMQFSELPDVFTIRVESENVLHPVSIFGQLRDSVTPALREQPSLSQEQLAIRSNFLLGAAVFATRVCLFITGANFFTVTAFFIVGATFFIT